MRLTRAKYIQIFVSSVVLSVTIFSNSSISNATEKKAKYPTEFYLMSVEKFTLPEGEKITSYIVYYDQDGCGDIVGLPFVPKGWRMRLSHYADTADRRFLEADISDDHKKDAPTLDMSYFRNFLIIDRDDYYIRNKARILLKMSITTTNTKGEAKTYDIARNQIKYTLINNRTITMKPGVTHKELYCVSALNVKLPRRHQVRRIEIYLKGGLISGIRRTYLISYPEITNSTTDGGYFFGASGYAIVRSSPTMFQDFMVIERPEPDQHKPFKIEMTVSSSEDPSDEDLETLIKPKNIVIRPCPEAKTLNKWWVDYKDY
jgi:hypothetical protein